MLIGILVSITWRVLRFVDGTDSFQMRRAAAIVLNKHSRIFAACGMDERLTISHCIQLAGYAMSNSLRPGKIPWQEEENGKRNSDFIVSRVPEYGMD
jgi:hypothetical protein